MLSRVAERLYWMSRYLERSENQARLLTVYSNLLFDLPRGARIGWHTLLEITGSVDDFQRSHQITDERAVIRFLLADARYPGSLLSTLVLARENARTTREIIPAEAWEQINNLYLVVRESAGRSVARGPRQDLLQQVIGCCQQLTGLFEGAMSHNSGYRFIELARSIERADMTTRIVHAGSANLLPDNVPEEGESAVVEPYENLIWMSILRSSSAFQMYRQHVQDRVNAEDVVTFLLQDPLFPRSVLHCLNRLEDGLQPLPHNDRVLRDVAGALRRVGDTRVNVQSGRELTEYIDALQQEIGVIHTAIEQTWLQPMVAQSEAQ
ncbi:MAG: alpha-E domain-containing protein [Pseudohongiellaceae bacterium]